MVRFTPHVLHFGVTFIDLLQHMVDTTYGKQQFSKYCSPFFLQHFKLHHSIYFFPICVVTLERGKRM